MAAAVAISDMKVRRFSMMFLLCKSVMGDG